ncbi:MAG TPA: hypothetical protein VNB94_00840 [Mycobacteriales bacterium]|nr:hypothetical protein [Mycobacteriales bacterium]
MASTTTIARLDEHPNLGEVLGVLAQLAHIRDEDLPRLAAAWRNTPAVASARAQALSPDSPLVCEVLTAFEALTSLFADDLRGQASYVTVEPAVTGAAMKAVRDAIAASYAKPALSSIDYAALMRAWREVYPEATVEEPDLGPQAPRLKELLETLPLLSRRCHDQLGQVLYDVLLNRSFLQESERAEARDAAFEAAVLTSRRRLWALVRRTSEEGLSRPCPTCHRRPEPRDRELERVTSLCTDAACALLVADALPDAVTEILTDPVGLLVPGQRDPSS